MHLLLLFAAKHAVALWLGLVGLVAFLADWLTGHI
jgi:hypothetical protein